MRVWLTQSEHALAGLAPALAGLGHEVLRWPLVQTQSLDTAAVRAAAEPLLGCRWLLFTSPAAVRAWREAGLPLRSSPPTGSQVSGQLLGAVGPGTAAALEAAGATPDLVGDGDAASLAAMFLAQPQAAGPIGLPSGDRALSTLRDALEAGGHQVVTATVYRTETQAALPSALPVAPDVVLLASPSAVAGLPAGVAEPAVLIAIGATTAAAVRATGRGCLQAAEPTVAGVVKVVREVAGAREAQVVPEASGEVVAEVVDGARVRDDARVESPAAGPQARYARRPVQRPRRLRGNAAMRELVAETAIAPGQLIAPYFVTAGRTEEVAGMPGVRRHSVDDLLRQLEMALDLGVRSVLLFGVVPEAAKSYAGEAAHDAEGPVPRALRRARAAFGGDLVLITDVCLCGYTDHGHCGLPRGGAGGLEIDNDTTLPHLAAMALAHAEAGADVVAPSDMMDGRVGWLRGALDDGGYSAVGILSYAVKYASAFYGPFREAARSAPGMGDRRSYQMDIRNRREARREARLDEAEAADMLMVKPALAYLDVISEVRAASDLPLVAYSVSGEYAMLKAAAASGVLEEGPAVREALLAMRRAGADLIISYHATEALRKGWLA